MNVTEKIREATKAGLCHEEVVRRGQWEPCGRTAAALRFDPRDGDPYPVRGRHARVQGMVRLADLHSVLTDVTP